MSLNRTLSFINYDHVYLLNVVSTEFKLSRLINNKSLALRTYSFCTALNVLHLFQIKV